MRWLIVMLTIVVLTASCTQVSDAHRVRTPSPRARPDAVDVVATDGGVTVDGVRLVPASAALRGQCAAASRQLGYPVPCPGLVPDSYTGMTLCDVGRDGSVPCISGDAFTLSPPARVPADYVGVGGESVWHMVILASRHPSVEWCRQSTGDKSPDLRIGHRDWTLMRCRPGGATHSGHLLLTTTVDDVVTEVSLHGHSDTNLRLLRHLVQAISFVDAGGSTSRDDAVR